MLLDHCSNLKGLKFLFFELLKCSAAERTLFLFQPSWLRPSDPDTGSPSLSGTNEISSPARHSLNPCSQETSLYVEIGSASWHACCSLGFWNQSACCWQVLRSFWSYCYKKSSSLPDQMPSTLPVPLRSLSFWTLDLWWAAGNEDRQRCQLSTSPWSIQEKRCTSKWNSHHPYPERWGTAWCAAVGRVFCFCPPEGRWWRSFLCKAPNSSRKGQSFFMLCWARSLQSHMHRKHAAPIFGIFRGFMTSNWFLFRHNHPELLDLNTSCH